MANGTLAASQLEMLSQSGTGIMTIVPPATNTNQTLTLPDSTGTVATLGVGTAVASTSGTSVDFTGIPSWVKRITVMFSGVSLSGTSDYLIQLGDAGGVEATGYVATGNLYNGSNQTDAVNSTSGFAINASSTASFLMSGQMVLTLLGSNTWVSSHNTVLTTAAVGNGAGTKTLSDTLTQVRITTFNGTDTFDAGTINIMYEG